MTSQTLAGWFFTTFSCLLAIISFLTTTIWLTYGIWSKIQGSTSKISKNLLLTNWGAAIAYSITTLSVCIHSIHILADSLDLDQNTQFIYDFESENLQVPLLLASFCYLIGKFLLYFVFYLRLFYLLDQTTFAYKNKYYFGIKCAIGLTCICAFLIIPTSMIDDDILQSVSHLFSILFLLCDIGVPITLNIMFIKKIDEIRRFIAEQIVPECCYQPPLVPIVTSTTDRDSDVTIDESDMQAQKHAQLELYNSDRSHKKLKRQYESLLVLITRLGLLSGIMTISSLIFLVIVAIYIWIRDVENKISIMGPILWISMAADGCINTVCLILYFNFATSMYKLLCRCCTTKCVSTVLTECLCKCCK